MLPRSPPTLLQSNNTESKPYELQFIGKRGERNIANKAYRSLSCSPVSAPAAAPVLAGAAPLAPKPNPPPAIMYAESQEPYNALETSENVTNIGKIFPSKHRSTPAAAPVLAGAAPKPNPPAIKNVKSLQWNCNFWKAKNRKEILSTKPIKLLSSLHTCSSACACRCCPEAPQTSCNQIILSQNLMNCNL